MVECELHLNIINVTMLSETAELHGVMVMAVDLSKQRYLTAVWWPEEHSRDPNQDLFELSVVHGG